MSGTCHWLLYCAWPIRCCGDVQALSGPVTVLSVFSNHWHRTVRSHLCLVYCHTPQLGNSHFLLCVWIKIYGETARTRFILFQCGIFLRNATEWRKQCRLSGKIQTKIVIRNWNIVCLQQWLNIYLYFVKGLVSTTMNSIGTIPQPLRLLCTTFLYADNLINSFLNSCILCNAFFFLVLFCIYCYCCNTCCGICKRTTSRILYASYSGVFIKNYINSDSFHPSRNYQN